MVGNNFTGGDRTTDNQMGIELQNADDNSVVASVEASTSAGKWRSLCIYYSFLLSLRITMLIFLFLQRLSSSFFDRETSFSWGRYTILVVVDVVLWAQEWALLLIFSAGPFLCTVFP